jgi:hypothetical protein
LLIHIILFSTIIFVEIYCRLQISYQDHFIERVADDMAVLEDAEAAYKAYLGSKRRMPALEQNESTALFQAESEHVLRLCVAELNEQPNQESNQEKSKGKSRLTITLSQSEQYEADMSLLLLKQTEGKLCIVADIHSHALTARRAARVNSCFF